MQYFLRYCLFTTGNKTLNSNHSPTATHNITAPYNFQKYYNFKYTYITNRSLQAPFDVSQWMFHGFRVGSQLDLIIQRYVVKRTHFWWLQDTVTPQIISLRVELLPHYSLAGFQRIRIKIKMGLIRICNPLNSTIPHGCNVLPFDQASGCNQWYTPALQRNNTRIVRCT